MATQDFAETERAKQEVRDRIWVLLERENAVHPPGAHGRIPNFVGAEVAAEQLAALPAWQAAKVIKANPDKAQLPVRVRALTEGKLVYMAVPRLADKRPFYLLDPDALQVPPWEAASSKGAATAARKVTVDEVRPVDLVVCGTVAVNREGIRIGKGGGFSDLEVALLQETGLLGSNTILVTTVHKLQVVDGVLPKTDHDFRVDLVVTPDEVIWCPSHPRPPGILWEHLDEAKIAAVPVLGNMKGREHGRTDATALG